MPDAPASRARGCAIGALHWVLYVSTMVPILVVVGAGFAVWIGVSTGGDPDALREMLSDPDNLMTPAALGASTLLQLGLMAAAALVLAGFLPRELPGDGWPDFRPSRFRRALALAPSHPAWLAAAALGTSTLGLLPGWVAGRMAELDAFRDFADGVRLIAETLLRTDEPGWSLFALAVVVAAPVCEEVVFRGYLWRAAEPALPTAGVWVATSVLFASYHGNPIHIVSVLPLGLYFGWLRWMSGSIWPGMLGHFVNNLGALVITLWAGADPEIGLVPSALGFAFTLAVALAAWRVARPRADA